MFQADEPAFGVESHTAPPSPISERFSNVTLLGGIFGCQEEPDNQPLTLTKSLEDLRMPKETEEPQVKLICQVRGLDAVVCRCGHTSWHRQVGRGGVHPGRIPAHRDAPASSGGQSRWTWETLSETHTQFWITSLFIGQQKPS